MFTVGFNSLEIFENSGQFSFYKVDLLFSEYYIHKGNTEIQPGVAIFKKIFFYFKTNVITYLVYALECRRAFNCSHKNQLFTSDYLRILTQQTIPKLTKDHFTRLHKWTSINSPIFAYFILLIIFTMCKPNLIVISPTPGAKRSLTLKQHNRQTQYSTAIVMNMSCSYTAGFTCWNN